MNVKMVYQSTSGELYHYGRKGMKWYQNIFTKGKEARVKKKRLKAMAKGKKRAEETRKKAEEEAMTLEQKKQKVLKSRSAKELYENAHLFTDQELSTAYNRLNLERNIKNLIPAKVNKGKHVVDETIDWGVRINKLTATGTGMYNNVAKIHNAFSKSSGADPLPLIGQKKEKKKDD